MLYLTVRATCPMSFNNANNISSGYEGWNFNSGNYLFTGTTDTK